MPLTTTTPKAPTPPTGSTTPAWPPTLWGLYITGQSFPWVGGFTSSRIFSIPATVFAGGSDAGWYSWDLRWD